MLNNENKDNFTALYTSNLGLTFGTNLMHASPRGYGIFVFIFAFFYKFMLFEFEVKDRRGDYCLCADRFGQSESGWGVYMQE